MNLLLLCLLGCSSLVSQRPNVGFNNLVRLTPPRSVLSHLRGLMQTQSRKLFACLGPLVSLFSCFLRLCLLVYFLLFGCYSFAEHFQATYAVFPKLSAKRTSRILFILGYLHFWFCLEMAAFRKMLPFRAMTPSRTMTT